MKTAAERFLALLVEDRLVNKKNKAKTRYFYAVQILSISPTISCQPPLIHSCMISSASYKFRSPFSKKWANILHLKYQLTLEDAMKLLMKIWTAWRRNRSDDTDWPMDLGWCKNRTTFLKLKLYIVYYREIAALRKYFKLVMDIVDHLKFMIKWERHPE